ncbi:MAG TPA: FecR domain-containing protein [Terriglobales bacterium]
MKLSWFKALGSFFLAAVLTVPGFGTNSGAANTAVPGTLNFVEGQASIQNQPVTAKSVGSADLAAGQTISTAGNGRAEVLLTPGVFLRLDHDSTVKMISPDITNTKVLLEQGRAELEVAELHDQNNLQVVEGDATTHIDKVGLYGFSAPDNQVRVFKGQANVLEGDENVKVKGGHEVTLDTPKLKSVGFDKKSDENDFYNWSALRSEYLSEASANAAQVYIAGGPGWIGPGWYWDQAFFGYTFVPGAGLLYSPFGPWGFYSPGYLYSYGPIYGRPFYGHGSHYVARPGVRFAHPAGPRIGFRGGPAMHAGMGFHGGFRH